MAKKEPLSWVPKALTFSEALALHDLESIKLDLLFARSCFHELRNRRYGIVYSPQILAHEAAQRIEWCAFVSGGIYYRRCFNTGVRNRLRRSEVEGILNAEFLWLHDALIQIVDKHIAHSVNEMELGCMTLSVAVDSCGKVHRGGIGKSGLGIGPFGSEGLEALSDLATSILKQVVEPRIVALSDAVKAATEKLSDQEVLRLSEGFTPHIDIPRLGASRKWPKQ